MRILWHHHTHTRPVGRRSPKPPVRRREIVRRSATNFLARVDRLVSWADKTPAEQAAKVRSGENAGAVQVAYAILTHKHGPGNRFADCTVRVVRLRICPHTTAIFFTIGEEVVEPIQDWLCKSDLHRNDFRFRAGVVGRQG